MASPDEVRRALEMGASRERVWAALTQPEELDELKVYLEAA